MEQNTTPRGLILNPPMKISENQLFIQAFKLDPQELRCACLLWDKVIWPIYPKIGGPDGDDVTFLRDVKFLDRRFFGSSLEGEACFDWGEIIIEAQLRAITELEKSEPGAWSIAQGERSLLIMRPPTEIVVANNAQLELLAAIPVPDKDVPLAEVFEFKQKRQAEFEALHGEISSFVEKLNDANDKEQELRNQISRVDKACADVVKVGSQWQFPVRVTNLKSTYELQPFATLGGAIIGAIGATELTATNAIFGAIAGGALASRGFLKLSCDGFRWRGLQPRLGPFSYVYHFGREVF